MAITTTPRAPPLDCIDAYLWPTGCMPLSYDNHEGRKKKDFVEIEKIEKYNQNNVCVKIAYNSLCVKSTS